MPAGLNASLARAASRLIRVEIGRRPTPSSLPLETDLAAVMASLHVCCRFGSRGLRVVVVHDIQDVHVVFLLAGH